MVFFDEKCFEEVLPFSGAVASVFQVIHKPKSVELPEEWKFLLSDVPLLFSKFLGLSAEKVIAF